MILVDTNVWSELLKPVRDERVLAWIATNAEQLHLSSIVLGELRFFAAKQDDGRRKEVLAEAIEALWVTYSTRLVQFGEPEAAAYAELMSRMRRAGTPLPLIDGWIAAQAIANDLSMATRNVADYARTGLLVINPWEA